MFGVFAAIAEFEREQIVERTRADSNAYSAEPIALQVVNLPATGF